VKRTEVVEQVTKQISDIGAYLANYHDSLSDCLYAAHKFNINAPPGENIVYGIRH
jgi:hypothetical protein